jgi:hypothetical protein
MINSDLLHAKWPEYQPKKDEHQNGGMFFCGCPTDDGQQHKHQQVDGSRVRSRKQDVKHFQSSQKPLMDLKNLHFF